MEKTIWTKKQQKYLDKRFGILESRMDKLESRMDSLDKQVKQNSVGINKIINILARSGMK